MILLSRQSKVESILYLKYLASFVENIHHKSLKFFNYEMASEDQLRASLAPQREREARKPPPPPPPQEVEPSQPANRATHSRAT